MKLVSDLEPHLCPSHDFDSVIIISLTLTVKIKRLVRNIHMLSPKFSLHASNTVLLSTSGLLLIVPSYVNVPALFQSQIYIGIF